MRSLAPLITAMAGLWALRWWHDDIFWTDTYLLATNLLSGIVGGLIIFILHKVYKPGLVPSLILYSIVAGGMVTLHDLISFKWSSFFNSTPPPLLHILLGGIPSLAAALVPGALHAIVWRLLAGGPAKGKSKRGRKGKARKAAPKRRKKATAEGQEPDDEAAAPRRRRRPPQAEAEED